MADAVKITRHKFDMPFLGRLSQSVGYWFCVWISSRLAFDASVEITSTVWFTAERVIRAIEIIRETILSS